MFFIDNLVSEGKVDFQALRSQVTSQATAASTLTLTSASTYVQVFTGSTNGQIVKMPDATTLLVGWMYWLINESTMNVTVQDNGGGALALLAPGQRMTVLATGVGSAAGSWSYEVRDKNPSGDQFVVTYPGTGLAVNYTGGIARFNNVTTVVAAGSITLTASLTNAWIYVDIDGVVKQSASLPNNAMALAQFTTSASAVTALADEREVVDQNTVWGLVTDIIGKVAGQAKAAGTLEKYARADHTHGNSDLLNKSGTVAAVTFAGTPKTAAVTFTTAMPDTNYTVQILGGDARSWTVTSKTVNGFTINANANQALTAAVDWVATHNGESV